MSGLKLLVYAPQAGLSLLISFTSFASSLALLALLRLKVLVHLPLYSLQAGLVPLVLNSHYRRYKVYTKARVVFDIHNLGYQV